MNNKFITCIPHCLSYGTYFDKTNERTENILSGKMKNIFGKANTFSRYYSTPLSAPITAYLLFILVTISHSFTALGSASNYYIFYF